MEKTSKFKIGDEVTCIKNDDSIYNHMKGHGWSLGYTFNITAISDDNLNSRPIYWQGKDICGVFEDFLEKVETEWDEEKN